MTWEPVSHSLSCSFQTNGRQIPLDETNGTDILGNIMEPSDLSVNPTLYGSLHGHGHNIIAYVHDPVRK